MGIELQDLSKRVGTETHIHPTSASFGPGFNVLLGRTQAGKTSLLRLIAGLDKPNGGRILVDGEDVTGVPVQRRNIAFVYQEFINYPSMTVRGNIASPLKLQRADRIDERVVEIASKLHIDPFLDRYPGELSGGQQQRLAIARALARDADLLLLDEPLVNLDLKLREELREELRELLSGSERVVIYATSEPIEALILGGRTTILHEGHAVQQAPVLTAYHRPANAIAGLLFSDPPMNQWRVTIDAGRSELSERCRFELPEHLQVVDEGEYLLGVRANNIHLKPIGRADIEIHVTIDLAEINGSETFIHTRHGEHHLVIQEDGAHHHRGGQMVPVYIDPTKFLLFALDGELVASYREAG